MEYVKYPRTEHLLGSKNLDLSNFDIHYQNNEQLQFPSLNFNESFIVEEKMDGIGLGICFINGLVHIQQRGHLFPLQETPALLKNFKSWVEYNEELLYCIIEEKYTLFGEWLEFKHTVFYNALTSPFLEYDIYDHANNTFLSTSQRYKLINNKLPSVKVIQQLPSLDLNTLKSLLENYPTSFFTNDLWSKDLLMLKKNFNFVEQDSLQNRGFEGFYIKVENEYETLQRYKWIRKEFFDIVSQNQHWKDKPLIKNIISSTHLNFHNSYI